MKNTLIKIKNNLQGINSRMDEAENQISNLEYKKAKNNQSDQEGKKIQKNVYTEKSLWDNFKITNIHIIRVLAGEDREQEIGNLFEKIMKENFPNLVKPIDIHVQEAQNEPKEANTRTHHN